MNAVLAALEPILAPLALELYSTVVYPALAKLDASVTNPDLKIAADALLAAIDAIAKKEL